MKTYWEIKKSNSIFLIVDKYEADQNVTLAESQLYALEERLEGQRAILTGYLKDAQIMVRLLIVKHKHNKKSYLI